MNERDLRVIKTRECIREAFFALLSEKPFERITVSELVRRARIAKGTFYLHYQDIFDLREQTVLQAFRQTIAGVSYVSLIFHDARRFVDEYQHAVDHADPEVSLVVRTVDPWQYQRQLVEILSERVFDEGEIQRGPESDVRLFALFGSFLSLMPVYQINNRDAVARAIADMAAALFPEVSRPDAWASGAGGGCPHTDPFVPGHCTP